MARTKQTARKSTRGLPPAPPAVQSAAPLEKEAEVEPAPQEVKEADDLDDVFDAVPTRESSLLTAMLGTQVDSDDEAAEEADAGGKEEASEPDTEPEEDAQEDKGKDDVSMEKEQSSEAPKVSKAKKAKEATATVKKAKQAKSPTNKPKQTTPSKKPAPATPTRSSTRTKGRTFMLQRQESLRVKILDFNLSQDAGQNEGEAEENKGEEEVEEEEEEEDEEAPAKRRKSARTGRVATEGTTHSKTTRKHKKSGKAKEPLEAFRTKTEAVCQKCQQPGTDLASCCSCTHLYHPECQKRVCKPPPGADGLWFCPDCIRGTELEDMIIYNPDSNRVNRSAERKFGLQQISMGSDSELSDLPEDDVEDDDEAGPETKKRRGSRKGKGTVRKAKAKVGERTGKKRLTVKPPSEEVAQRLLKVQNRHPFLWGQAIHGQPPLKKQNNFKADFTCCTRCSSKECLYAVLHGKDDQLQACLKARKQVAEPLIGRSYSNHKTIIELALGLDRPKCLASALADLENPAGLNNPRVTLPTNTLRASTGDSSFYTHGKAIRDINVSRGGKEGNNALTWDDDRNHDSGLMAILRRAQAFATSERCMQLAYDHSPSTYQSMLGESDGAYAAAQSGNIVALRFGINHLTGGTCHDHGFKKLHKAVLNENDEPLEKFLRVSITKKADCNSRITPAHFACINPNPRYFKALFAADSNCLMVQDKRQRQPIHFAAVSQSSEVLKFLLASKASALCKDAQLNTPLHHAARCGRGESIAVLVEAEAMCLEFKNRGACTPLLEAAKAGKSDALTALLELDPPANLEAVDARKQTALHLAVLSGNVEACKVLVESSSKLLVKTDQKGRTPLILAVANGHFEVTQYLLLQGAPADNADTSGNTAAHYAVAYGWHDCFQLLKVCPAVSLSALNDWKISPLFITILKGHLRCAKSILDGSAVDVNEIDGDGKTILHHTLEGGSAGALPRLKYLLEEKGADPKLIETRTGRTVFHLLAQGTPQEDDIEVAKLCCKYGAKDLIGAKDAVDRTALHWAATHGNSALLKFLLEQNASVSDLDECGFSALMLAINGYTFEYRWDTKQEAFEAHFAKQNAVVEILAAAGSPLDTRVPDIDPKATDNKSKQIRAALAMKFGKAPQESPEGGDNVLHLVMKKVWEAPVASILDIFAAHYTPKQLLPLAEEHGVQGLTPLLLSMDLVHDRKGSVYYCGAEGKLKIAGVSAFDGANFAAVITAYLKATGSSSTRVVAAQKAKMNPAEKRRFSLRSLRNRKNAGTQDEEESEQEDDEEDKPVLPEGVDAMWKVKNQQIAANKRIALLNAQHVRLGWTPLHYAVVSKYSGAGIVEELLRNGAKACEADAVGRTALMLCCKTTSLLPHVRVLLAAMKDASALDAVDAWGRTALQYALACSRLRVTGQKDAGEARNQVVFEVERMLIDAGANPHHKDDVGRSLCHLCFVGFANEIEAGTHDPIELVSDVCNLENMALDHKDVFGRTPLMYAAMQGALICSQFLCKRKASMKTQDLLGHTPLQYALQQGQSGYVVSYIDGVDPLHPLQALTGTNSFTSMSSFRAVCQKGADWMGVAYLLLESMAATTATCDALSTYNFQLALTILKKSMSSKAKIEALDPTSKQNLLHVLSNFKAASPEQLKDFNDPWAIRMTEVLTKFNVDVNLVDKSGHVPLHYAVSHRHLTLVKYLISQGVDLSPVDPTRGDTALHVAVRRGTTDLVTLLLDKKADINAANKEGRTPLMLAVRKNNQGLVKLILDRGAKLNVADKDGHTVLHHVIEPIGFGSYENTTLLKMLVDKGATKELKNKKGQTALDLAAQQATGTMFDALVELGAKKIDKQVATKMGLDTSNMLDQATIDKDAEAVKRKFRAEQSKKLVDVPNKDRYPVDDKFAMHEDFVVIVDEPAEETADPATPAPENDKGKKGTKKRKRTSETVAYDITLVKTDVKAGRYGTHNFYRMQALHNEISDLYILWTRWGRIGQHGKYQQTPFATREELIKEFCKIFKSKAGNPWADRGEADFKPKSKKYSVCRLQSKCQGDKVEDAILSLKDVVKNNKVPKMKRGREVGLFMQLIFDLPCIKYTMNKLGLAADYLSLGALKQSVLARAFQVLLETSKAVRRLDRDASQHNLQDVPYGAWRHSGAGAAPVADSDDDNSDSSEEDDEMDKEEETEQEPKPKKVVKKPPLTPVERLELLSKVAELSNEFYTLLPHTDFATSLITPLNSKQIGVEINTLLTMLDLHVAGKIMLGAQQKAASLHPLDYCSRALNVALHPVAKNSKEFSVLRSYAQRSMPQIKIVSIMKANRRGEDQAFAPFLRVKNRMLLWHGSGVQNFAGILCQGLRIAPPEADPSGYMFGKGLYFADALAKSIGYTHCAAPKSMSVKKDLRVLLLCDVALGKMNCLEQAEYMKAAPKGFHSTKGVGRKMPSASNCVVAPEGFTIPMGKIVPSPPAKKNYQLNWNEFIVYKESQARMQYIVLVSGA